MAKQLGHIEKLPSGSYRLIYKKDNKLYRKTIPNAPLKKIKEELNSFVSDVNKSKIIAKKINFTNLTQIWLDEYYRSNATLKSVDCAKSTLNKRILPYLGSYEISKITPLVLNSFYNNISKENISSGTIKKTFGYIKSILNFAYRMEFIVENPCSKLKLNILKNKDIDLHFYSKDEVKTLLSELENETLELKLIFYLAIFGGMRKSEIYGLKKSDIDFENNIIEIRRSRQINRKEFFVTETKTVTSNRDIAIPSIVTDLLKTYPSDTEFLFNNYANNLSRVFHKLQKRANLPKIKFHDLRHTNGTLLLSNGIDIKTVSEFLGHSNIRTTSIYVHAIDKKFKNVSDTLNNILN